MAIEHVQKAENQLSIGRYERRRWPSPSTEGLHGSVVTPIIESGKESLLRYPGRAANDLQARSFELTFLG